MLDLPNCAYDISDHYQVPIELVAAIRVQEGGCVGERSKTLKNGRYDMGPMQINSWWFEDHPSSLEQYGITAESVENDFCQNIAASVYILKENYETYGNNWWKAISAYNLGRPARNSKYLKEVLTKLKGVNRLTIPKCETKYENQ